MLCRFDESGTVTFASDHEYLRNSQAGKYTESTSLYELLKEDGPVLSFNTWNDVLTVFVDPVDPSTGEKDGYGLEGDHNFVILSSSTDEIRLRGERQSGEVRMYPCTKDWQQFLADAKQSKSDFFNSTITAFTFTTATDTLYATGMNSGIMTIGERLVDAITAYQAPFIVTDRGMRFQSAFDFRGVSAQEFVVNADSSALVSLDGQVTFTPIWQEYALTHTALWKLDTLSFNAAMMQVYKDLEAAFAKSSSNWKMQYIGVGSMGGKNAVPYGLYVAVASKKTGAVSYGGVRMNLEQIGAQTLRYTGVPAEYDNNLATYSKNNEAVLTNLSMLLTYIEGEYAIVPNNYFLPTGGTFTSTDGTKTLIFK
jgi:hypothetical protein